jgi:hypothetical protein
MDQPARRKEIVSASVEDVYDGLARLLNDACRFGLGLETLKVEQDSDGSSTITATFAVPANMERNVLLARLSRHPIFRRVTSED